MYQIKYVVVDSCFGADHKVEMVSGVPVWMFLVLKTPSAVLMGGAAYGVREEYLCALSSDDPDCVRGARGGLSP